MASLNASLSFKILPSLAHTTNKAAIIGMTRQLAMEGAEHGIRANSISPGLIESNATRAQLDDPEWASEGRILKLSDAFRDAMLTTTPRLAFRCGHAARVR